MQRYKRILGEMQQQIRLINVYLVLLCYIELNERVTICLPLIDKCENHLRERLTNDRARDGRPARRWPCLISAELKGKKT